MPELLQYSFEVVGMNNVERALASLERRFAQHNAKMATMFGARPGSGNVRGGAARVAGGEGMAGSAAVREQMALLKKVEREQISSAKRVERERIQSEKAVAREQQKQEQYWAKARQNARQADMEQLKQQAAARADFVKSTVGKGFGRVMNGVRAVGAAGLALTGVGGAALAASSVSQAGRLDEISRRLSIQGRGVGEQGMDPNVLRKQFTTTGIATGMAPEDVAAGASKYVAITGDIKGAIAQMKTFAVTAQAAGSNVEDIATASAYFGKIGIKSTAEVQAALAALTMQGKKGSFEIKNMATELPELISQAASLGVTGVGGLKQLGGMLQVVQGATGNAPETSTAMSNMLRMFISKAPDMETGKTFGHKVNVFSDKGHTKFRDYRDLIGESIDASRGDLTKLNDAFEIRGSKALNPFTTAYNDTRSNALKGGATDDQARAQAKAAALAVLDNATNAPGDFKEIERDAADAMKSFDVQLSTIANELKEVVATEVFPDLVKLAKELPALVGPVRAVTHLLVRLAEELLGHPLLGLGAVLAASVATEVLKAQLGKVLEGGVSRLTGGDGAGLPSWGGVGSVKGANIMGAVGTGAAVGITLASAIFTAGVVNFENAEVNMKTAGDDLNKVRGAGVEDVDMVRETVRKHRDKMQELENPSLTSQASNLISYGSTKDEVQLKTEASFLAEMEKKLQALDALKDFSARLEKSGVTGQAAADKMLEAATKLGVGGPNRGGAPSPVKP